jgi:molybdenum cofactor cytidylyltransferase
MSNPALSILIPAAGASKRLGQPKQLIRFQGSSLLQRAIDAARTLAPVEIIVVTGANTRAVQEAVQGSSVRWIHNPYWSAGMGSSIARGAAAINPESRGLMVLLCDQWRIQAQDLQTLTDTWRSDPQRVVVFEAQGRYMPPVIFPSACFEQLRALQGQQGARSLFKTHADLLTPVTMENAAFDLDTQNQLDELRNSP